MTDNWLLAIPVFNEQKHLLSVLGQALARAPHVLVIDDGSTDATPELLRDIAVVVENFVQGGRA